MSFETSLLCQAEDAPEAPDALDALGMGPAARQAFARACEARHGLILLSGEDWERTASALAAEHQVEPLGMVDRRDTAEAAIDAAGRALVAVGVQASNAVEAILALRRRTSDRFAFAAALRLVAAQRAAQGLCGECREPVQAYGSLSALLGLDPGAILWSAPGCAGCGGSGRGAGLYVFEAVAVDPGMRRLIGERADATLLARHAFLAAPSLASAARLLARDGILAPEEAVRLSRG